MQYKWDKQVVSLIAVKNLNVSSQWNTEMTTMMIMMTTKVLVMVMLPIITLMTFLLFVSSLHCLASWLITFWVCRYVDQFSGNCVIAVDGKWSKWSAFSKCSKTCGKGKKTRTRTCTNPPPSGGGKNCKGKDNQTKNCNRRKCPGMEIINFYLKHFHIMVVIIWKIICMIVYIFTSILYHP